MKLPRKALRSLLHAGKFLSPGVISHPRIRLREAAAYILAFALAVVIVGGFLRWHIASLYQQAMANWRARVSSIADDRARSVSDWLIECQADAQIFATHPSVRATLRAYGDAGQFSQHPPGSLPGFTGAVRISGVTPGFRPAPAALKGGATFKSGQQQLTAVLNAMVKLYSYAGVYVLDRDAQVVAQSSQSTPLNPLFSETCRAVSRSGATGIVVVGEAPNRSLIGFSAPVFPAPGTTDADPPTGQMLGMVLVVSDASQTLFPLVMRDVIPTRTGETILVRRQGNDMVYFSPLRNVPPGSPNLRFPLFTAPAPASLALEGQETFVEHNDYRGVPVLATTQHIPLAGWGLVRKIDRAEALEVYRRMAMVEELAGGLLIILLGGLLMFHRRAVLTRILEQAGEAQAHLAAIVESSEDAIIGKRLDGTIASWNRGAEQLYGYRAQEVMGRSIGLLVPAGLADELPAILEKIKRGQLVEHCETERVRKNGTRVPVSLTVSPVKDAAGAAVGASSIARDITARRRTEEALRDSEIQFRRLFEAAKDGILVLDADTGEIKDVNPFLSDLLDYPRADLLGKKLWEIGPLQDALLSKTSFGDLQSKGYVRYEHLPLETRSGKRIEVEFVSNVYSVNQLKVIQCNIRDISARKDAEEHLVQMESRYRGLLEAAPDAMVVVNQGGEIVLLNLQAEKQFGYHRDELVGKHVKSIIPEGFAERLVADALRSVEDALAQQIGTGIELAGRRKDGSDFPIEIMLSPLKSTEGILVTAAIRDITARKQAEEALRASEIRFRRLFEAAQDGILILDADTGEINDVNPFLSDLLDFPRADLLGKKLWEIGPLQDVLLSKTSFQDLQSKGYVRYEHLPLETRNGRHIDVEFVSNVYSVDHHKVIQCNIRDITERKRVEKALEKRTRELAYSQEALEGKAQELTRSNAELQQFAYVSSHDLQEPLRTMASFAQLLERRYRGKLDANADDFIHFIVDGATRMQRLISDLLAYSRVGSRGNGFASTDCATVFDQAVANLQMAVTESGAVVTHDLLPTVQGDGAQLIQVFQNLVGNSIKFRESQSPRVHVAAEQTPSEWVFSVQDNGIGIDPQYAQRIFEVFQRLHGLAEYPGSGIGLAITKKIVERHGGRIWVESQPHQGATFFFTLPI